MNSIVGWQYPEDTIVAYINSESANLLTIDFDFPCQRPCNLKCKYCFVETDEREAEQKEDGLHPKISVGDLQGVFTEAAHLGCRSAKLVGDQESLLEREFLPFIRFVSEELKIWTVIFTNGVVLSDDIVCERIHGINTDTFIRELKKLRVSIMLKFHSFSNAIEDALVQVPGYAKNRNSVLKFLVNAGFNDPPKFETYEEQYIMTGISKGNSPSHWTRLGLESVLTPQCLDDAISIYKLKAEKRLYIDIDPPVPVGLTRSEEWRRKLGLNVTKEQALDVCIQIYKINEEIGIPFFGASPYFGGLPCSQLPYGLYINARGRIYPCCGCPEVEADGRSEYLGDIRSPNALSNAINANPYRTHYRQYGFTYDKPPFNSPEYEGFGIYHGCPYRDRAGDILPDEWELIVEEYLGKKLKRCMQ